MTATATPTTAAIANELVALCRTLQNVDAVQRLYAADAVSVEPVGNEQTPAETSGIDAIRRKNETWFANNAVHGVKVIGPFLADGEFAVRYDWDFTPKAGPAAGTRTLLSEIGQYTVKDGRIVREQFFYHMPGV